MGAAAAPRPAARTTLLLVADEDDAFDAEDEAFDEVEAALLEDEEDLDVDTANAGLARLLEAEEEDGEAVGLPTGTPIPALMESIRLV